MDVFNNLNLRTKILAVAAIIMIMMLLVSSILYNGIRASNAREDTVRFTNEVINLTDHVLLDIVNMETGERGFLLTGDETFLAPYSEGVEIYHREMSDLQELVNDNAAQVARLKAIDQSVNEWDTNVLKHLITLRYDVNANRADMSAIADFVTNGEGKGRLDSIREQIEAFRIVEEQLLDERSQESDRAARNLMFTLFGGTAMALIGGLFASLIVAGTISRRINLVANAADGIADGRLNENYVLPSGQDEIGRMAMAFDNMAHTIRRQISEQEQANAELRAADATKVAKDELEAVVRAYSAFASEVAQGNLTTRLQVDTHQTELQQLGNNLNAMVAGLHRITGEVQQATTAIASATTEILAATTQQASGAAEQSAAITQTSTTVEEVKAIARQTAQQSSQVAQDSQNALEISRDGTRTVEETVAGMEQIRERVESIAQTILALSEQTQAIGAITTTVSELADQSNLLALNAAIEAARAGEQGKSFAVVAQHVRDLAERSKHATQQVREILSEIQRASNAAVLVTEEGTKQVESGGQLALQAGQTIHRIAAEVESGAQANMQMAAAAQQQTAGMEQIGQAMMSIEQATAQTLASTRQAERAAQDLQELARSLQKTIAVYQL